MGIFEVSSWNWLRILIPKNRKSIIWNRTPTTDAQGLSMRNWGRFCGNWKILKITCGMNQYLVMQLCLMILNCKLQSPSNSEQKTIKEWNYLFLLWNLIVIKLNWGFDQNPSVMLSVLERIVVIHNNNFLSSSYCGCPASSPLSRFCCFPCLILFRSYVPWMKEIIAELRGKAKYWWGILWKN